ncbi:hypothetical protein DBR32_09710 [Taibaiella sp. KBW10]|uniref:zinc ribbon domain-containing protein n=1 Tax=Taibaiella sp. KBW10 TaxID=2153357 RepID=UPI000F5B159F|nr:zinc ribbon domain-containing protein [Taibaiella sp. KBW10]RQO30973.1 hypothetical protein DBR32_09710 [Taibaiella sp. KBW10]
MESQNCFNCNIIVTENDNFCSSCGSRIKCKSCTTLIKKGASFCTNCGESFKAKQLQETTLNTIKYRKGIDEVSYEISFTNEVGKESMNELLTAIVNNRAGFQQIPLGEQVNSNKSIQTALYPNNGKVLHVPDQEEIIPVLMEIPHINDIETNLDCQENVWIGIHAFYVSDYGQKNFTKEEIRTSYIARRRTDNRVKNYTREWKIAHKKYFKTINDSELAFQTGKVEELKSIILGIYKEQPSKSKKVTNSASAKKSPAKSIKIEEFDLSKSEEKPSLEEFINLKRPGESTNDRIVVIAYYITRIVKADFFTEGQVEFAYKALQLNNRPGHLRQTINNVKNTKVWFKDIAQGHWSLERLGELYVEEKLPTTTS